MIGATNDDGLRAWLAHQTGQETVPQVFIGDGPVGGYDDISALNRSGELDRLILGA